MYIFQSISCSTQPPWDIQVPGEVFSSRYHHSSRGCGLFTFQHQPRYIRWSWDANFSPSCYKVQGRVQYHMVRVYQNRVLLAEVSLAFQLEGCKYFLENTAVRSQMWLWFSFETDIRHHVILVFLSRSGNRLGKDY